LFARVERQRVALALELLDQLLDLRMLRERDPTKLLDILLSLDVVFAERHASLLITPGDPKQEFFARERSA
jgi:hypothetical protein